MAKDWWQEMLEEALNAKVEEFKLTGFLVDSPGASEFAPRIPKSKLDEDLEAALKELPWPSRKGPGNV